MGRKFRDGDHRRIVQRYAVVCLASFAVSHEVTRDHQPCRANVQARITQRASSALVVLFRAPGRADGVTDGTQQRAHLRPGGNPAATATARSGRCEGAEAERPKLGILRRNQHCLPRQGGSPRRARGGLAPSSRSSKQQTLPGADASGKWRVKRAPAPAASRGVWSVAASLQRGTEKSSGICPESKRHHRSFIRKD